MSIHNSQPAPPAPAAAAIEAPGAMPARAVSEREGFCVDEIIACDGCGTERCDFRQRNGRRVCILCVERELEAVLSLLEPGELARLHGRKQLSRLSGGA
jgi:hypothetical protein